MPRRVLVTQNRLAALIFSLPNSHLSGLNKKGRLVIWLPGGTVRKYVAWAAGLVAVSFIAVWLSLPKIAELYLEREFGRLEFADVVKEADAANGTSLGKMGRADILLDLPADQITGSLAEEVRNAANLADLGSGWKVTLLGDPVVSFHPSAIRAKALLKLSNDDIGAATVTVQLDVVPSITGNELVAVTYVTAFTVSDVDIHGIHLPWHVADKLNDVIAKSLEPLNTKIPALRVALNLPDEMLQEAKAQPALLVSDRAVAALLGTEAETTEDIPGAYADEFIKIAKTILPNYVPGAGVIAVRPTASPLIGVSETMRDEAAAANLAALEATLGIDGSINPDDLDLSVFASLVAVTAEGRYFERQLKALAVKAISELETGDVALDVKPENIVMTLKPGVLEASASGTATIADGKLGVDFSLTAWGVLRPGPGSLIASYAPREIRVSGVRVAWADRGASLSVPYDTALGDIVARFIEKLPDSPLDIPNIPLEVKSDNEGDFRLTTSGQSLSLSFIGRAVSVAPERVLVIATPSLAGDGGPIPQAAVSTGQLERLNALASKTHQALIGDGDTDSLSLAVAKAGFAKLLENAWIKLDPVLSMKHQSGDTFEDVEIKVIPGDASCGNPCKDVKKCGDIQQCTRNICTTVVVDVGCRTWCPGGRWNPICREICDRVNREVCREDSDAGCISRIEQCAREIGQCTVAWGSGLQATCETALAAIKATDTTGLAKLSGGTKLDASGVTASGSRLAVTPDLSGIELAVDVFAAVGVDAWLDIKWTDWGYLFACPSGRLAVHLDANARLATSPLRSAITWGPNGDALKATFSFGKVTVIADAREGPLGKLISSNPGLLSCGLGRTIVGLTLVAVPRVTQSLLADAIRSATSRSEEGKIAAAIIDGHYRFEGEISPATFDVPPTNVTVLEQLLKVTPRMTDVAVIMGTGSLP